MMHEPLGLILAGGRGRRMGGAVKAAIDLGGQSLLSRAEARLGPQVGALAVSANSDVATHLPCLADKTPDFAGPLAGILSGLDWAAERKATHIVTVAVDTPFFPCDLVPRLILASEAHPEGLAIATTPDGQHGTFGLWPVSLRGDLAAFLKGGGRKVRAWTDGHGAALARFPETTPPAFFNINTPDDLTQAEAWL